MCLQSRYLIYIEERMFSEESVCFNFGGNCWKIFELRQSRSRKIHAFLLFIQFRSQRHLLCMLHVFNDNFNTYSYIYLIFTCIYLKQAHWGCVKFLVETYYKRKEQ